MTRLTQLIRTRREGPKASCAGDLRRMRAVQVLEILGTEDARKILAKVPDSSPYPRACREAREALRRMGRR